jgi:hypothetical protein
MDRTRLTIAFAVLAAVVVAAPTFALATDGVDFWNTEPAPEPLKKQFADMEEATSPDLRGRTPTAHFGEARIVYRRKLAGIGQTLYLGPMREGGFCLYLLEDLVPGGGSGGGGCSEAGDSLQPLGMGSGIAEEPYLVFGSSAAPGATHVEMLLADGTSREEELLWVSKPIDAGIYLLEVAVDEEIRGFVVRDAEGRELARAMAPNWPD